MEKTSEPRLDQNGGLGPRAYIHRYPQGPHVDDSSRSRSNGRTYHLGCASRVPPKKNIVNSPVDYPMVQISETSSIRQIMAKKGVVTMWTIYHIAGKVHLNALAKQGHCSDRPYCKRESAESARASLIYFRPSSFRQCYTPMI